MNERPSPDGSRLTSHIHQRWVEDERGADGGLSEDWVRSGDVGVDDPAQPKITSSRMVSPDVLTRVPNIIISKRPDVLRGYIGRMWGN